MTHILCFKSQRKLTKNLELSYKKSILQIEKKQASYGHIHAQVDLIETLDGQLVIEHQGKPMSYHKLFVKDHQRRILNRKEVLSQNLKTG